ncbi:MAG: ABC transporter substrate-binding protein [Mobilitalea sp.]
MDKNIKNRTVFISLFLLILLFVSCDRSDTKDSDLHIQPSSEATVAKETLNFRITWKTYSGRGEAIKKIVASYNALNQTSYQVTVVDGDEDLASLEALLNTSSSDSETTTNNGVSGTTDIYMLPYRFVQYFGYENKLEDLTEDFITEKEYFFHNLWELGVIESEVYGIPWLGHTMGLIYNQTLLEKAGVDPDQIIDLASLVTACEKVEATTNAMGIGLVGAEHNDVSWMVNQFIYGFGGSLISEDGSRVTINSEESKAALDFYKNILGAHAQESWKTDTGLEVMDAFRIQKIAFEIQGLWGVTDIWKNGKPFKAGVIPLERIGLYPEVGPMMLALPTNQDPNKRAAAIDFIRYLISTQAQELIMSGEYSPEHDAYYPFRIPVRRDIAESSIFNAYPEFAEFISGFNKPSIDVPSPLWLQIKDEYYAPGLHQVMEDQLSIDDFLQNIENQGNIVFNNEQR